MSRFSLTLLAAMMAASMLPVAAQEAGEEDLTPQSGRPEGLPPSIRSIIYREKQGGRMEMLRGVYLFRVEEGGRIVYTNNAQGINPEILDPATIKSMVLEIPEEIRNAFDAYQRGDYKAALPMLNRVVADYEPMRNLEGAPIKRAEILRLDCLRRNKEWEQLGDALTIAKPEEYDAWGQNMLEALTVWDGYPGRDWKRIEVLTRDIDTVPAGEAAAQMAFLRGEALRRLEKPQEALAEYHRAMTMDFTRSRDIMGDAALAALEIYSKDRMVRDFFERWGGPDYNEEAGYVLRTKEAAWLAHLLRETKPGGRSLPSKFSRFAEAYDNLQGTEKKKDDGGDEEEEEEEAKEAEVAAKDDDGAK